MTSKSLLSDPKDERWSMMIEGVKELVTLVRRLLGEDL